MQVPAETELFEVAVSTRGGCTKILGDRCEEAISLLAVASFQLQAAHVGAHMAEMAGDGVHTETLRQVASDYGGVFSAALNLSVRCSATAIDLCAAAIGRLAGISNRADREMDAGDFKRRVSLDVVKPLLLPTASTFDMRLRSVDFVNLETLRHEVTHRQYRRGVYLTTGSPSEPAPLAFPRQMDVELGGVMTPLDEAARWCVRLAESTFRDVCKHLAEI